MKWTREKKLMYHGNYIAWAGGGEEQACFKTLRFLWWRRKETGVISVHGEFNFRLSLLHPLKIACKMCQIDKTGNCPLKKKCFSFYWLQSFPCDFEKVCVCTCEEKTFEYQLYEEIFWLQGGDWKWLMWLWNGDAFFCVLYLHISKNSACVQRQQPFYSQCY